MGYHNSSGDYWSHGWKTLGLNIKVSVYFIQMQSIEQLNPQRLPTDTVARSARISMQLTYYKVRIRYTNQYIYQPVYSRHKSFQNFSDRY